MQGEAVLFEQCFSIRWCFWCACFVFLSLISNKCFCYDLIVPCKNQCMLLSFCGNEQNAIHFGIKRISPFCFKTVRQPDQFSVIFFCWVYVWEGELENCILVAVLIYNLLSVCCYIAKLLPSSVLECDGIRLYWLKFYSHQIRLAIESPD